MRHYIKNNFLTNQHRIEVTLVGAGGTGSQVLNGLAKIDHSLRQLGMAGLHITVYDDDIVSEANIGRQHFGMADVGQYKCAVLISRLNGYFGLDWTAKPVRFPQQGVTPTFVAPRMLISCVDTAKARIEIGQQLAKDRMHSYWLDFGNSKTSGQIILGTTQTIDQPLSEHATTAILPTVLDLFPDINEADEKDDTPSCSLREALTKQDLFTNSMLADLGCNLLWKFLNNAHIERHGFFMDVEQGITSPLMIDEVTWARFGYKAA